MRTKTKAKVGAKTAKTAARKPWLAKAAFRAAFRVGKPVAKRKVRRRAERISTTARSAREFVVVVGPVAAEALGLVEPPKRSHSTRRVLLGVVVGAAAMYYLRRDDRQQGPKPVP